MLTCANIESKNDNEEEDDIDVKRRVFVSLALEFGANFHAAYPTTTSVKQNQKKKKERERDYLLNLFTNFQFFLTIRRRVVAVERVRRTVHCRRWTTCSVTIESVDLLAR